MNKCTCQDVMILLEELCPLEYAESWDNVGLLVGRKEKEVSKIMLALDASDEVLQQAIQNGVDMLITHHPLIFSPLMRVATDNFIQRRVYDLIKNDISYYAMHTNFDVMAMADAAADKIGLKDTCVLEVIAVNKTNHKEEGIGRVGFLRENISLKQCADLVKRGFSLDNVRVYGELNHQVNKIAISTGSGKDFVKNAINAKADVLITGDIDHHTAIDAMARGLSIIDAGHFGTEHFMADYTVNYLNKSLTKLQQKGVKVDDIIIKSAVEHNPFQVI